VAATPAPALPTLSFADTVRLFARVLLPTIAKGVIIRRPAMVALAERLELDRAAVETVQRLRDVYPEGPLLVGPVLGRRWAMVVTAHQARRVLEQTPEPFATSTLEKQAALQHFEPRVSLISDGEARVQRRRVNDAVLEGHRPMHEMADAFVAVVRQEARGLLSAPGAPLAWNDFAPAWFRIVRRVVFGDGARDDHQLSAVMARLRAHANWAWMWPQQPRLRQKLFDRITEHLARAEPGSLAGLLARTPCGPLAAPVEQVPQWLFAFDPAGMATFRALALLASHPAHLDRARHEIAATEGRARRELPFLRACVLESLRLWPTSPLVLRETTRETRWANGAMPAGTGVILFAPFFHRDDRRLPFANRFAPEIWLGDQRPEVWPLIPFSLGSGICPARHLVLLLSTSLIAETIAAGGLRLTDPSRLDPRQPLPGTLNHFTLAFTRIG